jgi:hypothetical protein
MQRGLLHWFVGSIRIMVSLGGADGPAEPNKAEFLGAKSKLVGERAVVGSEVGVAMEGVGMRW